MPTPQGTRSLATELVLAAERVRDGSLSKLNALVTPIVTSAYYLGGEAKLIVDPEADEKWSAEARRTLDDLERIQAVIDALTGHLCRLDDDDEADTASATDVDALTGRVARLEQQLTGELRQIRDIVRELRDGTDGAQ